MRRKRTAVPAARELRRAMTPAETMLWHAVRDRRHEGLKMRRQHPVGPFVLDFAVPQACLAVEVDGDVHRHQAEADAARTAHLAELGWRVVRFANDDVLLSLDETLAAIWRAASESLTPQPPLPLRGERGSHRGAPGRASPKAPNHRAVTPSPPAGGEGSGSEGVAPAPPPTTPSPPAGGEGAGGEGLAPAQRPRTPSPPSGGEGAGGEGVAP